MRIKKMLAAACLWASITAQAGSASVPSPAQPVRFADCRQQIGVFGIDASDAAPFLPDGFVPVPFQDSSPAGSTGAPAPQAASATVQLVGTSCTPAAGQGAGSEVVTVMQAWLYVDPPDEFESEVLGPTPSPYVVVPWMVVSGEALAARLQAWGLPARVGEVQDDFGGVPGSLQTGTVVATAHGAAVRLDTTVPALLRETTPERLRLFGVSNRRLTGVVDFVEDAHTHLLAGAASAVVEAGVPAFPAPDAPGVAIHVEPGYGMAWERVPYGMAWERMPGDVPPPRSSPPPPPPPPPPAQAPAARRHSPGLVIRSAVVRHRHVVVRGSLGRRATGSVTVSLRSGRHRVSARRTVRLRAGHFRTTLPCTARRLTRVEVQYAGDPRHLPRTVARRAGRC